MNRTFTTVLLTFILAGCGGGTTRQGADPVYPVTGKVTYNNKPVAGADITFINAEKERAAFGRTNEEGVYELTTFSSNDGAVDGKAVVTVVKMIPSAAQIEVASVESEEYVPPEFGQSAQPAPEQQLPAHYADRSTSQLQAVVTVDGPNEFDFNLVD